jgi:DNA-binding LacI/PurR family transcriptional regulator
MPTMADIAKRAGVSLSTVSHALSGKRPISAETKERIFQAMADLDYQPNSLARRLATRRTKVIALVLPYSMKGTFESQFEFLTSTAETASELGYSLLLWTSPVKDEELLLMTQEGFIEGMILMEVKLKDSRVEVMRKRNYPFSLIGRCENNDGISLVDLDFEQVVRNCVEHLAMLGHRHIGLIMHSEALLRLGYGPAVRSVSSFEQAVRDWNVQGSVHLCEPTPQAGYRTTQALIAEHPSLRAIINTSGITIAGMVQAINDAGLRIPDDFSVVAVASRQMTGLATMTLTAVDFPAMDMGRLGAEMLIQQLEGDSEQPRQVLLNPGLTLRQTTGPYKQPVR